MTILLLTQDSPFFLAETLDYLFQNLPEEVEVSGCVVFDVSPFGKKETMLQKALRTRRIFGNAFFLKYGFRYVQNFFNRSKSVEYVLEKHGVPQIPISGSSNSEESLNILRSYEPDLLISIAGNQIFRKELFNLAPEGCLNLHTA